MPMEFGPPDLWKKGVDQIAGSETSDLAYGDSVANEAHLDEARRLRRGRLRHKLRALFRRG